MFKIISGGTLDNTGGDINKTSVKKHKSVKSEANPLALLWAGSSQRNNKFNFKELTS